MGKILAICPYMNGYCGAVIVDCSAVPPSVTEALSIETSVLVDLPAALAGRLNKRRELNPIVTEQLKDVIAATIETHQPDRILLEVPKAKSELQSQLAAELQSVAEQSGRTTEPISSMWRRGIGDAPLRRENARITVAGFLATGSVEQLAYDSTLYAAAMAAHTLFGAPEDLVTRRKRQPLELPAPLLPAPLERPGEPTEPIYDWRQLPTEEPTEPVYDAPTSAAIDPGSRYVALAIGEGAGARLALRMLHTFEAGEVVPLAKPRTIKMAMGGEYTVTTKRVLTTANVRALAIEVVSAMIKRNVKRLTIEHVDDVHISEQRPESASAIATHLVRNMWVATEIAVRAEYAGIEVSRVGASTWRARVAGSASAGADRDERIPIALREGFSNWPSDTNEHERDAGGLLLYGALPEGTTRLKERNRNATGPRKKIRTRNLENEKRAAEDRARANAKKRAEAGCNCKSKRHRRDCPMAKVNPKILAYLEANR